VSKSVRENHRRTRRDIARVGAVAVAIVAAGTASVVTAFAHHIVSTTPTPTTGVVNATALSDSALVYADNSRHIVFSLWAPNTCGTPGAAPVFTDSEPVTTSELTNSTVNSATYVAQQTGVYEWTAEVIVNADGSIENGPTACGDEQVTIGPATDSIKTTPSNADGATVGAALTDSATVTGFNPTGTVTFSIFGPNNANCVTGDSGSALASWVVDLSGNGQANVPAASGWKTTTPGTYNWVATYNGDNQNLQATSGCGSESVVVGKASPTITTVASEGGQVGTEIHDTAQVSGGANPTGTVSFYLYPPSDTDCTSGDSPGWVQHVDVTLGADGSASSAATPFTTTQVGTYNWIATYNGDANNDGATTKCSDESVTIGKDPTTVSTIASAGGVAGTSIHDSAHVTGTFQPTGSVTFTLYGPTDTTCSGAGIFTSTVSLDANGNAVSGSFSATTTVGTYNWVAAYSGDDNSAASTSTCGAEPVKITPSGGVQGITTPGTGLAGGITQVGIGIELLLGGLGLALGGELVRETRRRS
jgi:hypothetical protein